MSNDDQQTLNTDPTERTHPQVEHHESVHKGLPDARGKRITPWAWLPTANFASGVPYVVAATLSGLIAKNMGVSNEMLAYWTSLLLLPWTFKPLWGPLVDKYWTKRNWIILMQFVLGIALAITAFSFLFPTTTFGDTFGLYGSKLGNALGDITDMPMFFAMMILSLFMVAICSATYDIATDGYYMLALSERQQAWFVGIRSTFYRMAMIAAGGLLPLVAGTFQAHSGLDPVSVEMVVVPAGKEAPETKPVRYEYQPTGEGQRILVDETSFEGVPGDSANVMVRLSEPPEQGREVVVVTSSLTAGFMGLGGNKGFGLSAGDRITFTAQNWDQPTTITIASEKNLRKGSRAEYKIAAGNIPLSWSLVVGGMGVLFLLMFVYHSFVLPRPIGDRAETAGRPPFYKPLFWLGITIIIPMILVIIGLWVVSFVTDPLKIMAIENLKASVSAAKLGPVAKGVESGFKLLNYIIVGLVVVGIMMLLPARNAAKGLFSYTSSKSGIGFAEVFSTFFTKHKIGVVLGFILLFRLGESQIVKMGTPFMLDSVENGGLSLSVQEVGLIYQTIGVVCLIIGGIIGGWLISRFGLKRVIWPLVACMHLPNFLYVYLAIARPTVPLVTVAVGLEQLGYGIGFASFMMYLIFAAQGEFKTSHYALCTGFMSLGMMIPMMFSGTLSVICGYPLFFTLACLLVIPGVLLIPFLPMDESFGRKEKTTP